MKKVWVKCMPEKLYGYDQEKIQWKLGTVVGENKITRYKDDPSMSQVLSGDLLFVANKLLVEIEGVGVIEVWETDTYEPVEDEKNAK